MRKKTALCNLVMLLFFLTAGSFAQTSLDLTIANVEVTQAIQTPEDTISLVAGKLTAVRVYVGVSGTVNPVAGVTAELHVFQNGTEIPGSPFRPLNGPITAPLLPNGENENDTLNFHLPALPTSPFSLDLIAEVNPDHAIDEIDVENNTFVIQGLPFECRKEPSIAYVAIDYRPTAPDGQPNPPDAELIQPGVGDLFVWGIYPVPSIDYFRSPSEDLIWEEDINDTSTQLISTLSTIRQMIDPVPDFLYGWLPGNPYRGNGRALMGGRVAFGNTELSRFQRTFAHELGHNFGLGHNSRRLDDVGFDVDDLLGLGRPKPMSLYDIMAAGRLTHQAWIDTRTYNFLSSSPIIACPVDAANRVSEYLFVTGTIGRDGIGVLNPIYQLKGGAEPTSSNQEGRYALILEGKRGEELFKLPFDVSFESDSGELEAAAPFSLVVPVFGDLKKVLLVRTDTLLDQIVRSDHVPQVSILPSAAEENANGIKTISWWGFDPDSDDLAYSLQYSLDGGRSFAPLAVNLKTTRYTLRNEIPKSNNAIIRVVATDGLNTSVADWTVTRSQ